MIIVSMWSYLGGHCETRMLLIRLFSIGSKCKRRIYTIKHTRVNIAKEERKLTGHYMYQYITN